MKQPWKVEQWDAQYARQASWTRATRAYLYRRANLLRASKVLDAGCGTGVITEEIASRTRGTVIGIDIDPQTIAYASQRRGLASYRIADIHDLPFAHGEFEVCACHFVMMWCEDPVQAARELVRVTQPGGYVLVCAEPDYGGRVDHPDLPLGQWQSQALRREGADPCMGRKLRALFNQPEVRGIHVGLIPGMWDVPTLRDQFDDEWALWEASLTDLVPDEDLARVKAMDLDAINSGYRLAFLPVFYALIRV
jgi:SAM-dependent methyltransferase